MGKIIFGAVAVLWLCAGWVRADVGVPTVVFPGSSVTSVAVGPGGLVYAALFSATNSRIMKSVDGGQTWTPVFSMPTNALALDPFEPERLLAATVTGLYRTEDGGATWALLHPDVKSFVLVSPVSSSIVYGDGWKSEDRGATWRTVTGLGTSFGGERPHLKVSPEDPNQLFSVVGNTARRSTNGGETWAPWGTTAKTDTIEVDPVDARYTYLGACNGSDNLRFYPGGSAPLSLDADHLHAFAVDPSDPAVVYASSSNLQGVYRSLDFGVTWEPFASSVGPSDEGRMVFDRETGKLYVPGTGLAIVETWAGLECSDLDGDGYYAQGGCGGPFDSNDLDPSVHPGALETCDDVDNDSNGLVDEGCPVQMVFADADGDGFGTRPGLRYLTVPGIPAGYAPAEGDCDDGSVGTYPGAAETARDGVDQDCNGYDLTISVTKASWSQTSDTLTVEATSSYGTLASLEVLGFGPMVWNAKKASFSLAVSGAGGNPGAVTVSGIEGSVTSPVALTRKK